MPANGGAADESRFPRPEMAAIKVANDTGGSSYQIWMAVTQN
jgi:hypothetical protein